MGKAFLFETFFFFFYRILFGKLKSLRKTFSNSHAGAATSHLKYQKYPSSVHRSDLSDPHTLIFNVEGALLKSSSFFPYFMLVAFEAGGLLRSFILFLLYPLICLVDQETGLKIMVMVCFFGIKKESFRLGSAVLPKFFLEDVCLEAFEIVQRGTKKVAVTNFPVVMVESFLRDYLQIDFVVGRELKVFRGYFLGLMEERKKVTPFMEEIIAEKKLGSDIIGITSSSFNKFPDRYQLFSYCKEVYLVNNTDKRSWQNLPREKYPKPLIFHDGRLALRPTPLETLVMLMWVPFGFTLAVLRIFIAVSLPYGMSSPLLAFTGLRLTVTKPKTKIIEEGEKDEKKKKKPKGLLYVCNHRTLLDPLYLAFALKTNLIALTYSLSRMSEIISPIKTVRLTRNRDKDANTMERLLSQGDLVICPEGTTCREPYLLRFSPLFSEITEEIVPVAVNTHVSMFHGTTAGGLKCLDPIFFLMNPAPIYTVQLLDKVLGLSSGCYDGNNNNDSSSRFEVANYVQSELGKALGFERTKLTRRDKYLILAGNEGITCTK
ncbi:probable glycerol-3-phosphate acyltransferase 3 [Ziziphus jujuba]|uniref:Probable glycerol-3-phosphate acyltransferase 3 n=1 Tax=Ziziphus jujuba TaxID=326968 RepID=A0A6P4B093_ZIZJJ|nr:probable glycerol-3-phosphate acyltransferase 3 [Ziziphus jujuba]